MSIETCTWTLARLSDKASDVDPKRTSDYEDLYYYSDMTLEDYVQKL